MRSAGVALAAVMACAWAGAASAAPIYFDMLQRPPQNGAAYIKIVFDKNDPSINSFSYSYSRNDVFNPVLDGYGITTSSGLDNNASITATFQGKDNLNEFEYLISIIDPAYVIQTHYVGFDYSGKPIDTYIDTQGLSFKFQILVDATNFKYVDFPSGGLSGTVTGDLASLTPVPLPASAPLFGLALAGLGALGLRRKRSAKLISM